MAITWPQIAGSDVLAINQWRREMQGMTVAELVRHDVDGCGFKQLSKSAQDTTALVLIDQDTKAACESLYTTWVGYRGLKKTFRDNLGTEIANVMIKRVLLLGVEEHAIANGGTTNGKFIMACQFVVKETAV